jgi:hypothetical protein
MYRDGQVDRVGRGLYVSVDNLDYLTYLDANQDDSE